MQLPFTREQFRDLFVAYNQTLWPVVVARWTASALIAALRLSRRHRHDHRSQARIPTFGLPCPTTIFTAGVLMLATPRAPGLSIVPVIWSAIGGSAAFLLGVPADIGLPIAGIALAIFSTRRIASEPVRAGRIVAG